MLPKTHYDSKNHEKKEFKNSNVVGKQIENSQISTTLRGLKDFIFELTYFFFYIFTYFNMHVLQTPFTFSVEFTVSSPITPSKSDGSGTRNLGFGFLEVPWRNELKAS